MLVLIALRLPIGVAMGAVAFGGFWYLRNFNVALSALRDTPFVFAASWDLSAIPMFLLMGAIASNSGIGTALFRAAHAWFGALPGGLAVATNWACAGFGAASGSSVAAAAVMARLAVPEMLKQKYDKGLATGVCASGGTLDALIPPSILFVIYGVFAEVSVPKLLIAGIIPGILTAVVYMLMIIGRCRLNPSLGPPVEYPDRAALWRERWASVAGIWPILVLIVGVIGGLYAGVVTPTEGGACGAFLAAVIGMVQRKLTVAGFIDALKDAMSTTAQLFFVGVGAILYTKFLALSGTADMFKEMIGTWALDPLLLGDRGVDRLHHPRHVHGPAGHDPAHHPGVRADVLGARSRPGLVRRAGGQIHRHQPADAAGRLQHLRGRDRHRQFHPAEDDLSRLLLVPRLRGRHHDAADRVSANLAVSAEPDEMKGRPRGRP